MPLATVSSWISGWFSSMEVALLPSSRICNDSVIYE